MDDAGRDGIDAIAPEHTAPPPAGARHPFPESMVITTLPTLRPVSTYR
jgi:hypothetical protein